MIVRKLRLTKGWSQEELAELTGLSVRTIQRIERGRKPGLESRKALAAVFETDVSTIYSNYPEDTMSSDAELVTEEKDAIEYVRDIKGFYTHSIVYLIVITFLVFLDYKTNPNNMWSGWTALGWGMGVLAHGFTVFERLNIFSARWEKKQVEKRLGRKL